MQGCAGTAGYYAAGDGAEAGRIPGNGEFPGEGVRGSWADRGGRTGQRLTEVENFGRRSEAAGAVQGGRGSDHRRGIRLPFCPPDV